MCHSWPFLGSLSLSNDSVKVVQPLQRLAGLYPKDLSNGLPRCENEIFPRTLSANSREV